MEPAPSTTKLVRALMLPGTVVVAMEAYYIAYAPPQEQRRRIVFAIVTLAAFVLIAVLSIRKQTSSPESPRLSPFTLAGIALVIIIVAVLFRHL